MPVPRMPKHKFVDVYKWDSPEEAAAASAALLDGEFRLPDSAKISPAMASAGMTLLVHRPDRKTSRTTVRGTTISRLVGLSTLSTATIFKVLASVLTVER